MRRRRRPSNSLLLRLYHAAGGPAGYSGITKLYRAAVAKDPKMTVARVKAFLTRLPEHTLHVVPRKSFPRRRTISYGLNEYWQADLAEMGRELVTRANGTTRFWLCVIDVWSRFARVLPLKRKTGAEVSAAFESLLLPGKTPKNLSTDWGGEFHNAAFKAVCSRHGINHYSTGNYETKAALAERLIRTLKGRLHRYLTRENTTTYLPKLRLFVAGYNAAQHRGLGMAPIDVAPDTAVRLPPAPPRRPRRKQLRVGARVRLVKVRTALTAKGYKQQWTREVFRVIEIRPTRPTTYRVGDLEGSPIGGAFYFEELQPHGTI